VKAVEAEFIQSINHEQDECCEAHRQSKNVDEGESFLFQEIPDGDGEVVFYHEVKGER
jgi:hypothetical protein